jgi:hypothetical protein
MRVGAIPYIKIITEMVERIIHDVWMATIRKRSRLKRWL